MEAPQQSLFHEDIWQALGDCVRVLGGNKKVGSLLRPEMDAQEAGRWLANCLSPSRPEKICLEQVQWLLREARRAGCHAAMTFLARDAGYADPQPIEPEDERAALQREFIEQSKHLQQLFARMERAGVRAAG
jgi:hypothetical protein